MCPGKQVHALDTAVYHKGSQNSVSSAACERDCIGLRHCQHKLTWPRPRAGRPPPHRSTSVWQSPSGRRPRAPLASACSTALAAGRLLISQVISKAVWTGNYERHWLKVLSRVPVPQVLPSVYLSKAPLTTQQHMVLALSGKKQARALALQLWKHRGVRQKPIVHPPRLC